MTYSRLYWLRWTYFKYFPGVSLVDWEEVNPNWVVTVTKWGIKKDNDNILKYATVK